MRALHVLRCFTHFRKDIIFKAFYLIEPGQEWIFQYQPLHDHLKKSSKRLNPSICVFVFKTWSYNLLNYHSAESNC
ncbi:hypothetical protein BpHYR1_032078 [Brachionus plicatilis]|uniref:Uncharacterized protein n=1 Tax=Brachionus plicatilis TaxID=10195 RepID=A0A3M7T7N3_BRAPC|nr:hypothetical protein BpHYR1_032078 [Brachionus plicatilis]